MITLPTMVLDDRIRIEAKFPRLLAAGMMSVDNLDAEDIGVMDAYGLDELDDLMLGESTYIEGLIHGAGIPLGKINLADEIRIPFDMTRSVQSALNIGKFVMQDGICMNFLIPEFLIRRIVQKTLADGYPAVLALDTGNEAIAKLVELSRVRDVDTYTVRELDGMTLREINTLLAKPMRGNIRDIDSYTIRDLDEMTILQLNNLIEQANAGEEA